jgi:quinol monooxygenase YgiN
MTTSRLRTAILSILVLALMNPCSLANAQPTDGPDQTSQAPLVRLAELEIEPAYLEAYKAALKEGIEAAIRLEPGVLTMYAVSLRDDPTRIRILETYADIDAYNQHIQSPHFQKYKTGTLHMIRSLTLVDTDPILLRAKP